MYTETLFFCNRISFKKDLNDFIGKNEPRGSFTK
jgi:hypothetical protein